MYIYCVWLLFVFVLCFFFFFKQKTAYEMRISDWSSDVCSSDLFALKQAKAAIDVAGKDFQKAVDDPGALHQRCSCRLIGAPACSLTAGACVLGAPRNRRRFSDHARLQPGSSIAGEPRSLQRTSSADRKSVV